MLYLGVWAAFSKNYCHIWWPSSKNKNPLIWDQKYLIWVFRKSSSKNYSHIWNHSSQIFLIVKFRVGINMSKFWTQNTYLGISLKFQIWRNYCHIWNQQSRICLNKKKVLCTKKKKWNQECLIWVFWAAIFKTCCHIWSQRPKICPIAMFGTNIKTLKFRTKKILDFGIFGLQFDNNVVIKMGIFRLEFQKTNIRFEVNTLKFV